MAIHTIPPGAKVSYRQQYRRCGKAGCPTCGGQDAPGHGPYWYAFWWADGRVRSQYVGKKLPEQPAEPEPDPPAAPPVTADPESLWVRTLGGFTVWLGPAVADEWRLPAEGWARRKKAAALLRYLLSASNCRAPREAVMDALWPDAEPGTASSNFRYTVHLLRKIIDRPDAGWSHLRAEGDLLVLLPTADGTPPPGWLDAAAFDAAASAALAGRDADACRAALALYRGEYLPDETYEDWALARREELRARHLALLLHLARLCRENGEHDEAKRCLRDLLAADPTHEDAARDLLRLQALDGHRTEAIRTYRQLADALRRELGEEPDPETQALYKHLLDGSLAPTPTLVQRPSGPAELVQPALDVLAPAEGVAALSGRTRELATLHTAFERLQTGHGGLVLLSGGAGAGKSRLLAEFLQDVHTGGGLVLIGRAYLAEGQLPYGPLQDALRTFLLAQPDTLLREQAAFHTVLVRLIPDLARPLPDLPAPAALEPRAERHRLFAALAGLLRDLSARKPLVLAVDDLHWADRTTLEALHYLARTCADTPLLIVGAYRTEDLTAESAQAELLAAMRQTGTALDLQPLDSGESAALIRALLAPDRVGEDVRNLIAGQARGNPLYIHLLVAALRESGRIVLRDERWQTVIPAEEEPGASNAPGGWTGPGAPTIPVPASIRALILERAARLSPDAGRLLRLCAVLGQLLIYEVLLQAADLEEEALLDALDDLLAAQLLEETAQTAAPSSGPFPGYAFRHPLIQEAIYQQIPARRRQLLHRRAGESLEVHLGRQSHPHAADLAWHFDQSGRHAAAAHYAQIAGDRAAASYAAPEAIAHYLRAAAHHQAMQADPETGDSNSDSADALVALHEKLGDLHILLGQYAAAEEEFRRARTGVADPARRADLWGKESDSWLKRGDYVRAIEIIAAAEAEGVTSGAPLPPSTQAALVLKRGEVQYYQGQFGAAVQAATRALEILGSTPDGPVAARAYLLIANVATQQSDHAPAEAAFQQSLALWERQPDGGNQEGIAMVWSGLGLLAHDRGDYSQAEERHRHGLAIRERIGHEWGIAASLNNLGNLAFDRGDYPEAAACYRRSLVIWDRLGEKYGIGAAWNNLGNLALALGDLQEAQRCQERSLAVWGPIGNIAGLGVCSKNLGGIALARGDLTLAEDYFQRAAGYADKSGIQEYLAGAWVGIGTVALERGDVPRALALFRAARRLGRRISSPAIHANSALQSGRAYLRTGGMRVARAMLAHARALIDAHSLTQANIDAHLLQAELHLAEGDHLAARVSAETALQLAAQSQVRPEQALALHQQGRADLAASALADARDQLEAALAIQTAGDLRLQAAHTRLSLARCLIAADPQHNASARELVEDARATFAAAGALPGQAEASQLLAAWQQPSC